MNRTDIKRVVFVALVASSSVAVPGAAAHAGATPPGVAATISTPGFPALIATGFGSVWVAGHRSGVVYRIDPSTNQISGKVSLPGPISGAMTVGGGGVCFQSSPPGGGSFTMYRIDPSTMRVVTRHEGLAMVAGAGSWWFSSFDQHAVIRVRPSTGRTIARVTKLGVDPNGVNPVTGVGFGSVWVYAPDSAVIRISPATNRVAAVVPLPGDRPTKTGFLDGGPMAFTSDSAYVATPVGIYRIDPQTNAAELLPVKVTPFSQWGLPGIATNVDGTIFLRTSGQIVSRIDPQSGNVTQTYPADGGGGAIAIGFGSLWVANASSDTVWRVPLP